jgi:hypothetical protein
MAQTLRTHLTRIPKQEHEVHLFSNPMNENDQFDSSSSSQLITLNSTRNQNNCLTDYDYHAPLTAHSLRPNSNWLIVRRNLHRIRFMGFQDGGREGRLPDLYLGIQMTRELKHAQEEIKNVDKDENFHIIKAFSLSNEDGIKKKFDISHVKPDDALIYDRLGDEPLALQNLLYYFSKRDVQHGTIFWNFLNEVNHVLNLQRKRTLIVQRLRRLALTLAVILYSFIGLMLFLMIISVIVTATKMNDPEVVWMDQRIGGYSSNIVAIK